MRLTVAAAMEEAGVGVEGWSWCCSVEAVSGLSRLAKPVEAELDCM